jgi:Peptidase family S41
MKNLLSLLLLAVTFTACGQKNETAKDFYSVEELKQDFNVFRASLEEGHPGLYRYKSKAAMDSIFAEAAANITKQMTDREFMFLISNVAAQVGDGHLRVVLPKVHKGKLDEGPTAIPFRLYYLEGKLYVSKNFPALSNLTNKEFLGAQIISINGHTASDFLKKYLSIACSDGNNETLKYNLLQRGRAFQRYFNIFYGYTESYLFEYIPLNENTVRTSKMQGVTFDDYYDAYQKENSSIAPAEFNISTDNEYAYLRITSFDKEQLKNKKINLEKFLAASFKSIDEAHIKNLILDLRGNGGGTDEYGKILFSYFTNQPFDYYESLRMNKESFDFFKYTSSPGRKAPKGMLKANNEGTFDNIQHPNVGKQNPTLPTFTGNIYVLINGGCFSTTSEFLSMLHYHTKAVFIGEESGGGYYGNCSGPTPEFFLPNTKVSVEIPLMNYTMAVKGYPYMDRGLIPNHVIIPSIKDRIDQKDAELEFVKSLIKK